MKDFIVRACVCVHAACVRACVRACIYILYIHIIIHVSGFRHKKESGADSP